MSQVSVYLPQSASTNDEILKFLAENPAHFFSVYTFNQTNGKGQYGNNWQCTAGENLACTIALKTELLNLSDVFINYYTATLVRNFLAKLTDRAVEIKWPNDIIIDHKKVCGILIEKKNIARFAWFILGVGININQKNFDKIPSASSLALQAGKDFDLRRFAEDLIAFLKSGFENILLAEEILTIYNHYLFKKDRVAVFEVDGLRQNGIIKCADANGYLQVDLEHGGEKKFYHKEIKMLY